ncbi:MAG: O-antigen ligase family protein [Sphingomonadaceae bacterium]
MKWIALVAFIALVPLLYGWLRNNPRHAPYVWSVFAFLPFISDPLNLNVSPIVWPMWSGYVTGIEVSLVDAIALAILLSRQRAGLTVPYVGLWVFFALTTLLSAAQAATPQTALFVVWQVLRTMLIAAAAMSICLDTKGPRVLIIGLAVGLAVNAGFALSQKFGGALQAGGLYGHQNLAGMVSHFVAMPALALFLVDSRQRFVLLGVGAAIVLAIVGASRGTIGLAGAGYVMLLGLSLLFRPTARKTAIVVGGLVALALAAPLALSSLNARFAVNALDETYNEREAMEATAAAMLSDHPMGVGANHYVIVANAGGYSERGGVNWFWGSRAAHVHNVYMLTAAESGYLGLVAFTLLLCVPMILAYRTAWRFRQDPRSDLMIGYGVALTIVALHNFYEWIFVTYQVQQIFAITVGAIGGLSRRMASDQLARRRQAREARASTRQPMAA